MNDLCDHSLRKNRGRGNADYWHFFDSIYCISLEDRVDRRKAVRAQFEKVGLLDRVVFLIVQKNKANTEQGIYESHIRCLKDGLRNDARNMLVFED